MRGLRVAVLVVWIGGCSSAVGGRSLGVGTASFEPLGDVDGDGFDDFAIGEEHEGSSVRLRVWWVFFGGPRDGVRYGEALRFDAGSRLVALGDVDDDGGDDVLVVGSAPGTILSYRDGAWSRLGTTREVWAAGRVGDVTGDGVPEVLVEPLLGPALLVSARLESLVALEPAPGAPTELGWPCVDLWWDGPHMAACTSGIDDVDGDGRGELSFAGEIRYSGGLSFGGPGGTGGYAVPFGDVLGDGRRAIGLVSGNMKYWWPTLTVLVLDADGIAVESEPLPWNHTFRSGHGALGDLDGDGRDELLYAGRVFRMSGTALVETADLEVAWPAGDVDGDGLTDVVSTTDEGTRIRYGDPAIRFEATTALYVP